MFRFNLLPQQYKENFKKYIFARLFYVFSGFVLIWGIVIGIILFTSFEFLAIQNNALEERIMGVRELKETEEAEAFEAEIISLNKFLGRVNNIKEVNSYDVFLILQKISPMVPEGSSLDNFTFSATTGKVSLKGRSVLRTHVITLENRLKEEPLFKEIDSPLSNLLQAEDVEFSFSITLE